MRKGNQLYEKMSKIYDENKVVEMVELFQRAYTDGIFFITRGNQSDFDNFTFSLREYKEKVPEEIQRQLKERIEMLEGTVNTLNSLRNFREQLR